MGERDLLITLLAAVAHENGGVIPISDRTLRDMLMEHPPGQYRLRLSSSMADGILATLQ